MLDVKDFPGVKLYEDILPDVVSRLTSAPDVKRLTPPSLNGTGSIPYHRGSPYGGKGWDTADPTVGDVHQWNVWGGKEYPYHDYDILGGRFVSYALISYVLYDVFVLIPHPQ
jgi:beta-mannosidase